MKRRRNAAYRRRIFHRCSTGLFSGLQGSCPAPARDLAGQPGGPIERAEHEAEPWHNLVTALMYLLRDHRHLAKTDEMRRAIEHLKPDDYRRLGYFDKWAVGMSTLVVEKGLMTRDEIERRGHVLTARYLPTCLCSDDDTASRLRLPRVQLLTYLSRALCVIARIHSPQREVLS
jgi:hypothetical protein